MARKAQRIEIDASLCKGCHICIEVCPHDVLRKSDSPDNRGFFLPEVKSIESCKVCHLCELGCPDFAIVVIEE